MSTLRVIDWRGQSFRYSWLPSEPGTVCLVPIPGRTQLTAESVSHALVRLRSEGASAVVTAAVPPECAAAFENTGFLAAETLVVLSLDPSRFVPISEAQIIRLRSVRPWEIDLVLSVDAAAFEPKWWLHRNGYDEAMAATPRTRARVIAAPAWPKAASIDAFLLSGFAGTQGFVQRLAVHPDSQGRGYASALLDDAVRWMKGSGVDTISVNTHPENERALAIYEHRGFVRAPHDLTIWRLDLATASPSVRSTADSVERESRPAHSASGNSSADRSVPS